MPATKQSFITITITDCDGKVLDRFPVAHWRTELDSDDFENFGSHASNALLIDRIERAAAEAST